MVGPVLLTGFAKVDYAIGRNVKISWVTVGHAQVIAFAPVGGAVSKIFNDFVNEKSML